MRTIHEIISRVQTTINFFLTFISLIAFVFITILEIKISTETRIRLVGADQNAFIHNLEETIIFDDFEGQELVLQWLIKRHNLSKAYISKKKPSCTISSDINHFFHVCWSLNNEITAYHKVNSDHFLIIKTPIKFFFDGAKVPAGIILIAIFILFVSAIRSTFKKLAHSIHDPLVELAESVEEGLNIPVVDDIQELNTLAEKLVIIRDIERDRAITKISRSLAHDIKNSLGIFESVANIATLEDLKSWQYDAKGAIQRTLSIIDKFGISELEKTIQRSPNPLDPASIVREIKNNFPGVLINVFSDWNTSEIIFNIDPVAINRAIINLIKNSVEAKASVIDINASILNNDLIIHVIDNGPGVPPEIEDSLFNLGETFGKPGGQGIGLFNVKSIVEAHQGSISYKREENNSVFSIKLPNVLISDSINKSPENNIESLKTNSESVLVSLKDKNQQEIVINLLENNSVKIKDKMEINHSYAVAYTDDLNIITHSIDRGIPIIFYNTNDEPENIAKRLAKIFQTKSLDNDLKLEF